MNVFFYKPALNMLRMIILLDIGFAVASDLEQTPSPLSIYQQSQPMPNRENFNQNPDSTSLDYNFSEYMAISPDIKEKIKKIKRAINKLFLLEVSKNKEEIENVFSFLPFGKDETWVPKCANLFNKLDYQSDFLKLLVKISELTIYTLTVRDLDIFFEITEKLYEKRIDMHTSILQEIFCYKWDTLLLETFNSGLDNNISEISEIRFENNSENRMIKKIREILKETFLLPLPDSRLNVMITNQDEKSITAKKHMMAHLLSSCKKYSFSDDLADTIGQFPFSEKFLLQKDGYKYSVWDLPLISMCIIFNTELGNKALKILANSLSTLGFNYGLFLFVSNNTNKLINKIKKTTKDDENKLLIVQKIFERKWTLSSINLFILLLKDMPPSQYENSDIMLPYIVKLLDEIIPE